MHDDEGRGLGSDGRVGRRFGDYLVEDKIGQGGMGVVYRARHTVSGRMVALKLMAPDLAHNHSFRERFINEAEAGPNLRHPNIVPVLESGDADGELFIAMELVEGTDLKGLIQQEGRLDPRRVLSIFRQAAGALDAAHESGLVHRDVKPQNILVTPRKKPDGIDQVFLTDFGLVRPLTSETSASRTGQVFGSVAYMAPELIEGIPADGRADVYALGCVLYECLTGEVPFERENEVSTVWAHIHEDPPLVSDVRRDLPGGLNDVVFKAMAKHPDDRFLTCGEFVEELEQGLGRKLSTVKYAYVRPLVARVPRKKTEREVWAPNFFPELSRVRKLSNKTNWARVVSTTTALMLLAAAMVQFGHPQGVAGAVEDVADVSESVVAAVTDIGTGPEDEHEAVDSERPDTDKDPKRASGDTRSIKSSDGAKLKTLLPVAVGERSTKPGDPSNGAPRASEGWGKIVWAKANPGEEERIVGDQGSVVTSDIWIMDPDGSNQVRLTAGPALQFWPSWSPDGRHIAYIVAGPRVTDSSGWTGPQQDLWVMTAAGKNQRDMGLCPGLDRCGKLAWSPDGRRVAYVQGTDLYVADLAAGTRELLVSGEIEEAVTPPSPNGGRGPGPTWSPNGKLLAFTCGDELCVVDVDGGEPREVGPALADPDWSPTGDLLVGEDWPDSPQETSVPDIVVQRPEGTGRRVLIDADEYRGEARRPSWAPDGSAIVYSDEKRLFRVDRSGAGRVALTSGPTDLTPDWWGPSR